MFGKDTKIVLVEDVFEIVNLTCIYSLNPIKRNKDFYLERVNRNLGWISLEEQEILRQSVIGVAGAVEWAVSSPNFSYVPELVKYE